MEEAANSDIGLRKNTLCYWYPLELIHQAVKELDQDGIFTYCISLGQIADEYVSGIFGWQYTVIDNKQRLLPAA